MYLYYCQTIFSLLADIAQEFLQEFTLAYNTAYGVEYTKLTLKEIDAESFAEEKPAYQLMQRSVSFFVFLMRSANITLGL